MSNSEQTWNDLINNIMHMFKSQIEGKIRAISKAEAGWIYRRRRLAIQSKKSPDYAGYLGRNEASIMRLSETAMSACNFEYLLQLINNQLDLDKQIEVYAHLERCDICRDAIHQISRDLKGAHYAIRGRIDATGSGRAQPASQ